jgi:uncharacterized protein GlcG (DUF336 family)
MRPILLAIVALLAALTLVPGDQTPVHAQSDAPQDISLEAANRIIQAAITKSEELDTRMNIAILDVGGNLKAFARMDGAWLGSIDIALKKAKTSRLFDAPTGVLGPMTQPGEALWGIEQTNDGLVTFAGGLPIRNSEGKVIGAIGVSGSTVENDHTVAQAGIDAL